MAAATVWAQTGEGNMRDVIRINNNSYMVVFPFESHQQYSEFEYNRRLLSESYSEMNSLKIKVEAEKDEAKKKILNNELSEKTMIFQANEDAMVKGYNYSNNRQYLVLFLKSHICVPISDEEFSNMEFKDGTKIDMLKIVKSGNKRFYRNIEIDGFQNNQDFQGMLAYALARRTEMSELRNQLADIVDVQKINETTQKLTALEAAIKENEKILDKKFGLKSGSTYMVEIEKARLMLLLTPEEIAQIQAQSQAKN